MLIGRWRKWRTDTITDWGDGEGKASDGKDRKKQELRKAGIVTTRIWQQSRCTTFWRSEAKGQEQQGRSCATRGCRYRVGPGRSRRVSQGGSSRSQVAGPGKSVSIQSIVRDLMADTLSLSACRPFMVRDLMADTYPHGCWTLFYPPFFPAYLPGCLSKSRVPTSWDGQSSSR